MSSLSLTLRGAAREAADQQVPGLVDHEFASRLAAKDYTLWGPEAEDESSKRLGWVSLFDDSRALLPRIAELRSSLAAQGADRIVLAGMGGSSLAPEVICATAGVELTILDSTDPQHVGAVLAEGVARTVLVVSSKSGSTVETDSQRRIVSQAFEAAGIDPASRTVIVTDPGSPLAEAAYADGVAAVFEADPTVGGRYSALTAFGLVPSGLAGADLESLLDDAEETASLLSEDDPDNAGLRLGSAMCGTQPLRNKLIITDAGSPIIGLGAWIEQLVAESTGKNGTGILPVLVADGEPELHRDDDDALIVELVDPDAEEGSSVDGDQGDTVVSLHSVRTGGSLGAQFVLWEVATVVGSSILGINPFDQPDVESAKAAARGMLDSPTEAEPATAVDGAVELSALGDDTLVPGSETTLAEALTSLIRKLPDTGYLAVMAYLDRLGESSLEEIRPELAEVSGRPVTFGWGPRFLHSTGQFHKGGPHVGAFIQVTSATDDDLDVPGRGFTLGTLIGAQAAGDAQVLADHGMPVLRLHLTDRARGLQQLREAVDSLS